MPKNICKVLIGILALGAIPAMTLEISCTPPALSKKGGHTQVAPSMGENLPSNEKAERVAPVLAKLMSEQNPSPPNLIQLIYTITALLATPMIMTGYLNYKWRKWCTNHPSFLKGKLPKFLFFC